MSLADDLTLRITELERKLQRMETSEVMKSSEAVDGVIELATQAEVNTGTDAVRAVTPATLKSRIETADAAKVSKLYASDLSPIALEANGTGELSTETGTQLSTVELRADTNDDADTKIAFEAYKPAGTASRLTHIRWNQNTRKMTRLSQHPTISNGRGGTDTLWHMRLMEGAYDSTTYEPLVAHTLGCSVWRNSDLGLTDSAWNFPSFTGYLQNPHSLTWWDSGSALYAPVSGWYIASFSAYLLSTGNISQAYIGIYLDGGSFSALDMKTYGVTTGISITTKPKYFTAGQYIQGAVLPASTGVTTLKTNVDFSPILTLVKI